MIKVPVSFNGHAINDGTNYAAYFPLDFPHQVTADTVTFEKASNFPEYGGKKLGKVRFSLFIEMLGTIHTQRQELKTWFDVSDDTPHKLIVKDTADSNKEYYWYCTPTAMPDKNASEAEIVLETVFPVWLSDDEDSDTWTLTASGQTKTLTVASERPTPPVIQITPTISGGTDLAYKHFVTLYNPDGAAPFSGWFDLGDDALDTAALVTAGHLQADGDDLRVFVDGQEKDRWLDGINTSTSKIVINIDLAEGHEMTLSGAIASTGAVTTIPIKKTKANKSDLTALTNISRSGMVQIGTEIYTYTDIVIGKTYYFDGATRATKGTSMAAHSDGDTVRWLQHEIWLMHGNAAMTAPEVDDTVKPMVDMATSTNASPAYTEFADEAGLRTGAFKSSVVSTYRKTSDFYSGSHGDEIDPATEMGMRMSVAEINGKVNGETATLTWDLYDSVGITHVTSNGDKKRVVVASKGTWPGTVGLQKSLNGKKWTTVWNEAAPTAADTWEAWTHSASSLSGTYKYIRFVMTGSIKALADLEAYFEVQGVTLTRASAKLPQVSIGAEQSNYQLEATFSNAASGEQIVLSYRMNVNETLTIDCEHHTLTYADNQNALPALTPSNREDWFDLIHGDNVLTCTYGGGTLSVAIKWRDRAL